MGLGKCVAIEKFEKLHQNRGKPPKKIFNEKKSQTQCLMDVETNFQHSTLTDLKRKEMKSCETGSCDLQTIDNL